MLTPKPYLSFSQMALFEMSPEKYAEQYIYNQKQRISRNMAYGSQLADSLEIKEASGDPLLDLMASRLPKFKLMDKPILDSKGIEVEFKRHGKTHTITIPALSNGKDHIPLLAIPDSVKNDYSAFYEYKSSVRKWTQKMADDSGQITFYTTTIWLATNKIPIDIELVNVETTYQEDGRLTVTGNMFRFPTKRTMTDIIKMTSRIRNAWAGIKELCQKELF